MQSDARNEGSSRTTYGFVPSDHLNKYINQHLSELFRVLANTRTQRCSQTFAMGGGGGTPSGGVCALTSQVPPPPPTSILSSDFDDSFCKYDKTVFFVKFCKKMQKCLNGPS